MTKPLTSFRIQIAEAVSHINSNTKLRILITILIILSAFSFLGLIVYRQKESNNKTRRGNTKYHFSQPGLLATGFLNIGVLLNDIAQHLLFKFRFWFIHFKTHSRGPVLATWVPLNRGVN